MQQLVNTVTVRGREPVDRSLILSCGQMFFVEILGESAVVMITDDTDMTLPITGSQQGVLTDADSIQEFLVQDNLLSPFDILGKLETRA